jgi:protein SCO1
MRIVLIALLFLWGSPVWAGLSRVQLEAVSAEPAAGAHLDPNLTAPDPRGTVRKIGSILAGRIGLVTFVDYTCNTLCGTDLALLSIAIQNAHLASSQYHILAIGIDPRDSPKAALAMERKEIPAALWPNTTLLLPDARDIRRATTLLGFHYAYDPVIDQFAHPAVIYAITASGDLRAVLSPLNLTPENLRAAISSKAPPTLFTRIVHLCYAYDPATGVYTPRITVLLKLAAAATVMLLAGAVLLLIRFGRRAI